MKTNPTIKLPSPIKANFSVVYHLIIFSLFIGLILCGEGCATYKSTAGKTIASIDKVVDGAMKDWAIYVKVHGATPKQENTVRDYYERYQTVLVQVKVAYANMMSTGDKTIWEDASKSLLEASGLVIQVITVAKAKPMPPPLPR